MPAERLPWFRIWVEAMDHEKIAMLDDSQFRTWVLVLSKASQQPTRWRIASAEVAARITGRPRVDVDCLIAARLLDECPDGLWVHDWESWQKGHYPSDYKRSAKTPPTVGEDSANVAPTLPQRSASIAAVLPLDIDIDRDIDVDVEAPIGALSAAAEEILSSHPPQGFRGESAERGEPAKRKRAAFEYKLSEAERDEADAAEDALSDWKFEPTTQFWRKCFDEYGRLNMETEALKMAGWLKAHRKRQCNNAFVQNWLRREAAKLGPPAGSLPAWDGDIPASQGVESTDTDMSADVDINTILPRLVPGKPAKNGLWH